MLFDAQRTERYNPDHAPASPQAIALRLQTWPLAGRVTEVGAIGGTARIA